MGHNIARFDHFCPWLNQVGAKGVASSKGAIENKALSSHPARILTTHLTHPSQSHPRLRLLFCVCSLGTLRARARSIRAGATVGGAGELPLLFALLGGPLPPPRVRVLGAGGLARVAVRGAGPVQRADTVLRLAAREGRPGVQVSTMV